MLLLLTLLTLSAYLVLTEASLMAGHVPLEHATVADDVAQGLKDLDVLPESFMSPQCAQQVRPSPCIVSAAFQEGFEYSVATRPATFGVLRVRGEEHA